MDLFDLQASISVAINDAIDNLIRLGNLADALANQIQNGIGGNNEAHIDTSDAQENVEDLTDDVEDQEDAVDDLADGHSKLGTVLGGVGKGMLALGGLVAGVTGGFLALGDGTQEFREDMGKLETAFKSAGHTTETATKMYDGFYAVLGEEDRSVEAVAHLAKLTESEEELAKWTDICAGVMGAYGDSLPIEGLTEASNETAKTGVVTGALAYALNWAGASEEEFNEQLAQCNSEQERATLITETLNGLYKESAENYKEMNGGVMSARDAQNQLTKTIAEFGKIAEPIMTNIKVLVNDLLQGMLPFVQLIGEGLTGAMNGSADGASKMAEGIDGLINDLLNKAMTLIPKIAEVVIELFPQLINTILENIPRLTQVVLSIIEMLVVMVAEALPQILIKLSEILPDLILAILDYIPALVKALTDIVIGLVDALPIIIQNLLDALPGVIDAVINVLLGTIDVLVMASIRLFMAIVDALPTIVEALVEALPKIIDTVIESLVNAIPLLLEASIALFMALINALPTIIQLLVIELPKIILTIQKTILDNYPLIVKAAIDLFMGIVKAIPQILGSLGKALGDIATEILDSLSEIDLFEVGKEILQGLIDGMVSIGKNVWGAVKEIGSSVVDGFKDFFDIHSPSRLIKNEVGFNIGEAVGVGAVEALPSIHKNIDELNTSVYEDFNTNLPAPSVSSMTTYENGDFFDRLFDKLDAMERAFLSLKIYMHNEVLVGELMPAIDEKMGDIQVARERGR